MTELEKLEKLIHEGFKETHDKFEKTERFIDKLTKQVSGIIDSLGRFSENMVAPAIERLFKERGIPIVRIFQRASSKVSKIEYDIIAVNSDYAVVVSIKMTLRAENVEHFLVEHFLVEHFLKDRLPVFKVEFPEFRDKKIVGAVAGMNIVQDADIYAMKHGLYILAQSGENVTVLNDKDFEPVEF